MVLWGLMNLREETPAPESVKAPMEEVRPAIRKENSHLKLSEQWAADMELAARTVADGTRATRTEEKLRRHYEKRSK